MLERGSMSMIWDLTPFAEKPLEIDHHLCEFGSVQYHIQSQASNPLVAYLSISTPSLCHGVLQNEISSYTIEMVKRLCPEVVEIVKPAREGYQLTLRLNLNQIPPGKDYVKVIGDISTVQSVILSSQLKEILWNVNSDVTMQGMFKPIKLVYHPREPFFIIMQPQRIIAVFPIRFKEKSDVIIATTFFQELVDVGSSDKWAKAPPCTWSAIPPPELRGETLEDLSTNGGFVTFDISSRHIEDKRLDKTVWNLLNFNAYVRYHVKSTKGYIQRRMRKRLKNLVQVLHHTNSEENEQTKQHQVALAAATASYHNCSVRPNHNDTVASGLSATASDHIRAASDRVGPVGYPYTKKHVRSSKYNILKQRCGNLGRKIKMHFRLRIHGFGRFRQRWLRFPKFSSKGYTKLE